MVRSGDEIREESTMQQPAGLRRSIFNVICECYVTGSEIDLQRNNIIERVEEVLEADRTRGGVAVDTRLSEVTVNQEIDQRYGQVNLNFEVEYIYTRGAA